MKTITEPRFLKFTSSFESHLKNIPTIPKPPGMFASCLPLLSSPSFSPAENSKERTFLGEIVKITKEFLPQALPSLPQAATTLPDEESALLAPTSSSSTASSLWSVDKSKNAAAFLLALFWVCKEYSENLALDSSKTRKSQLRRWVWDIAEIIRKDDVLPDDETGFPAESAVQGYEKRLLEALSSKTFSSAYRAKFKPVSQEAPSSRYADTIHFNLSSSSRDSGDGASSSALTLASHERGYQSVELLVFSPNPTAK